MVSAIGVILLLLGLLGSAAMLILAIRSMRQVYHVKCQRCGHTTQIPREAGEYPCQGCGIPLAKVSENK
ncbi:MAG: hypothetical protein ACOY35_10745 [Bacillota bacterium]